MYAMFGIEKEKRIKKEEREKGVQVVVVRGWSRVGVVMVVQVQGEERSS